MATVDMYNIDGKVVGSVELDDNVFGIEVNEHVVHAAVVAYLANQRQGTKATKTRAEVRGGGAKPRPQKGTGRSRQGSIRSPQWTGGGVVFAHKPRDFSIRMNRKEKRLALKSVLTSKVNDKNIIILDQLDLNAPKTKDMIKVLGSLKAEKALVVTPDSDKNAFLSARNIPGVKTASVGTLNVYDILKYDKFIVTKDAALKIQEVYA
ncbi:MAG: 50S ribosomal protein L4 [Defluviitaleaceae bacterium]|nr:50S ribosomal protein L4 [Defluviitaleaceae bacterium]MCL2836686.1 50S ribosomal protein L4 [Defluviitaleaceae bacterium]